MSSSNLNTNDSTANNGLRPRLCHLRKWSFFQGYGFNLHAEKTRNGQFIGKVDPNSPAEIAGLHEKDRIIEVNYVNISNENHQQVVKRIRNGLEVDGKLIIDEVVLLVVDQETDDFYKKQNKIVRWDDDNVLKMETPREDDLNQLKNKKKNDHIDDFKLDDDNNSNYKPENKSDSSPIVTPIVTPILLKKAVSNDSIGKDSKGKADVDSSSNRDSNLDLNDHNDEPFHMNNDQKKSVSNSPSISDHRIEVIPQNSTLPQTPTLNEKSNSHSNSSTNLNGNNRKSNGSSPLQTPPLVNRSNNSSFSKENKQVTNESTTKLMDNNSITDTTNNNNPNDPFTKDETHKQEEKHEDKQVKSSSNTNLINLKFKDKAIEAVHQLYENNKSESTPSRLSAKGHIHNLSQNILSTFRIHNDGYNVTESNELQSAASNNNDNDTNSNQKPKFYANDYETDNSSGSNNANSAPSSSSPSLMPKIRPVSMPTRKFNSDEEALNYYLEMSAAEFKNYLKNKHKVDPREARVDMKQKFKIFQDM